jgi:hypothetical protein
MLLDSLWSNPHHERADDLHTQPAPLPVRLVLPVARHGPATAECAVPGCPHAAAGYKIVRGWQKLCAGHVAVRWRHLSKGRQRFYLRRYKRRLREASKAERVAKRALMRKIDSIEGRRQRRETERAKTGRLTRAEADAAKRERCAGGERQTMPEKVLGICRRTYQYRKLGTAEAKPMGRPSKADAMTPAERKRRQRAKSRMQSAPEQHVTKSLAPGKRRQKLPYTDKQAPTEPAARGACCRDRGTVRAIITALPRRRRSLSAAPFLSGAQDSLAARSTVGDDPRRFARGPMQTRPPVSSSGAAP